MPDVIPCRPHTTPRQHRDAQLDASPLRAIESCWEGELPGFDNVGAASELFESLMGLWNELARHQSATKPFRLTRMEAKPDTDDIRRLCRTRTEELEGFIDDCSVTWSSWICPNGPTRLWTTSATSMP